jgi:predicted O-methyltransferase YrrM
VTTSRSYADFFVPESEVVLAARSRAADLGCVPIGSGAAAALTFLAATIEARSVVEVGTGAGISGLHLLAGMAGDGILTSIDVEAEHHRAAKKAFIEAGIGPMVFVDGARTEYPQYVTEALRLLRPGGILALDGALAGDKVADPTQRDSETVAVREAGRLVRDDETLFAVMIPLGDGLLAAVKRG